MLASPGVGIAGVVTNLHKPWFRVYTRQRGLQGAPTPTVEGCNTSPSEPVLTVRSVGNNCSQSTSVSRVGAGVDWQHLQDGVLGRYYYIMLDRAGVSTVEIGGLACSTLTDIVYYCKISIALP